MKHWLCVATLVTAHGCSPAPSPSAKPPSRAARAAIRPIAASTPSRSAATAPVRSAPAAMLALDDVVRADDTFDSLRTRLGASNVRRQTFMVAEGEQFKGWAVFPDDPTRSLAVYTDEAGVHPMRVMVGADATAWTRRDGVRIGLDSNALEKLNGRPFEFAGFGWDYGGQVMDWKGGRLARHGNVVGPVSLCEDDQAPEGYPSGDRDFASDLAVMRSHPARVCEFGISFGDAPPAPTSN